MDLELSGKTAVITGASRGIGKAVAREFLKEGIKVVGVARTEYTLREACDELRAEVGGDISYVVADTRFDESVRDMATKAASLLGGRIDILINSAARAGGGDPSPKLEQITGEMFWDDVDTKVVGYLRCAREIAPYMKRQGWGRIINLSGIAARQATSTITSIRNAGVVALTKNLGDELGPYGINVTAVHPGLTWTERIPGMIERRAEAEGKSQDEIERKLAESNSIRRFVDAKDIAYLVTFLASPKSLSINGDVIAAGGGVGSAIHY